MRFLVKVECKECRAENPKNAEYCLECGQLFEKEGDIVSFSYDLYLNYLVYASCEYKRGFFSFLIGGLFILGGIFTNNISYFGCF